MAAEDRVNIIFRGFAHRRYGIIKALTKDLSGTVSACKAVPSGAPYGERYLLWGTPDKTYVLKKASDSIHDVQDGFLPQPVPLYYGGMQGPMWLKTTADYCEGWLVAHAVHQAVPLKSEERTRLVDRIGKIRSVSEVVLKCYSKTKKVTEPSEPPLPTLSVGRQKVTGATGANDPLSLCHDRISGNSNCMSSCEAETCQFVTETEWVQCVSCHTWFHLSCADVKSGGDHVMSCSYCP